MKYKSKFQDVWLEDEKSKVWLQKDIDETQAYCRLCMKVFSITTHGKTSLSFHTSGETHKARVVCANQKTLTPLITSSQQKNDSRESSKTTETKTLTPLATSSQQQTTENETQEETVSKNPTSFFIAEDVIFC